MAIAIAYANARVKTTPKASAESLTAWLTSKELIRQGITRREGEGCIWQPVPGSAGDLIIVNHGDGTRGVYTVDELDYLDPKTQADEARAQIKTYADIIAEKQADIDVLVAARQRWVEKLSNALLGSDDAAGLPPEAE